MPRTGRLRLRRRGRLPAAGVEAAARGQKRGLRRAGSRGRGKRKRSSSSNAAAAGVVGKPRGRPQTTFGCVVPLGTLCFTAQFCRGEGLRQFKIPFDWCHSSAYMVRHAVQDDFKDLLNPRLYYKIRSRGGSYQRGTAHKVYSHMSRSGGQLSQVFLHHNLLMKAEQDSLHRAAVRLRRVLALGKNGGPSRLPATLFILCHTVPNKKALQEVRQQQLGGQPSTGRLPVPEGKGCHELTSVAEVRLLFACLCRRTEGPFHMDAIYLVLRDASEARGQGHRASVRHVLNARGEGHERQSLAVHEIHCAGECTGLHLHLNADRRAVRRVLMNGRTFMPAQVPIDDAGTLEPSEEKLRSRSTAAKFRRRRTTTRRARRRLRSDKVQDLKLQTERRIRLTQANPKGPGSDAYKRYQKYKAARTIGQMLELGACTGDILYDQRRGHLTLLRGQS